MHVSTTKGMLQSRLSRRGAAAGCTAAGAVAWGGAVWRGCADDAATRPGGGIGVWGHAAGRRQPRVRRRRLRGGAPQHHRTCCCRVSSRLHNRADQSPEDAGTVVQAPQQRAGGGAVGVAGGSPAVGRAAVQAAGPPAGPGRLVPSLHRPRRRLQCGVSCCSCGCRPGPTAARRRQARRCRRRAEVSGRRAGGCGCAGRPQRSSEAAAGVLTRPSASLPRPLCLTDCTGDMPRPATSASGCRCLCCCGTWPASAVQLAGT